MSFLITIAILREPCLRSFHFRLKLQKPEALCFLLPLVNIRTARVAPPPIQCFLVCEERGSFCALPLTVNTPEDGGKPCGESPPSIKATPQGEPHHSTTSHCRTSTAPPSEPKCQSSSMDALSVAFLFVLLTAACCAPAGLQDACAEARTSSLDLNQLAKTASAKVRLSGPARLDLLLY